MSASHLSAGARHRLRSVCVPLTLRVLSVAFISASSVVAGPGVPAVSASPGGPPASADQSGVPDPVGEAVWPLDPRPPVVEEFAPPATRYGAGHRGVDLAGRVGQVVRAAQAGTVTYAARLAGRGVVVVSHGATRTTYEPVTATVAVGDRVGAGESIGRLELRGSHCLPTACLHWGLLAGERYHDPLELVGAGPVRLLPWAGSAADVLAARIAGPSTGSEGLDGASDAFLGGEDSRVPQLPGWRPLGDAAAFRG